MLSSRIGLVTSSSILHWKQGGTITLPYVQTRNETDESSCPWKSPVIFKGGFVDYGQSQYTVRNRTPLRLCKVGRRDPGVSVEIISLWGYCVLVRGGPASLFLGQTGGKSATFLPCHTQDRNLSEKRRLQVDINTQSVPTLFKEELHVLLRVEVDAPMWQYDLQWTRLFETTSNPSNQKDNFHKRIFWIDKYNMFWYSIHQ